MSRFGEGYFSLHSESAGKLKTFSAVSRASSHSLKLEVVFEDAIEMGYAVEGLTKLLQRAKKPKATRKPLALPAPGGEP